MKKLSLLFALIVASAVAIGAASAAPAVTVTLRVTPNPVVTGGVVSLSGTVTIGGVPAAGQAVTLTQYNDAACTDPITDFPPPETTDASGRYTYLLIADVPPGDYFFQASSAGAVSACVISTVVGGGFVAPVSNVLLCYTHFSNDMIVLPADRAALALQGKLPGDSGVYWQPWAIAGKDSSPQAFNVGGVKEPDGTVTPSYHLVCSLTGTQKATGAFTDNDGDSFAPSFASVPGVYPIAA